MSTWNHRPRSTNLRGLGPATAILAASFTAGCGGEDPVPDAIVEVTELSTPASGGSGMPNLLAHPDGSIHLSWLQETEENGHALRLDRLRPGSEPENTGAPTWEGTRTIIERDDFFVNWADFPSLGHFPDGRLAAHWLVRSGPGPVDYDIHLAWSDDGGERWSEPVIPHRDGFETEHGFVSLLPWEDGSLGVAWLDGREIARAQEGEASGGDESTEDPAMTLRFTILGADGELGPEKLLDDRVCDCCPTSGAITEDGPVVVYRDRTSDEIRDISIIRHREGDWTQPEPVHRDGWRIAACPVNGPRVAADGRDVAVAWYTGADDQPRVHLAFSTDAGEHFAEPIRVDDGNPLGRVTLDLLPSGDALVGWLEEDEDGEASVRIRRITPEGRLGEAQTVGRSVASRAAGFPQMARVEDHVLMAWTDARPEDPQVRAAWARVEMP